MRNLIIRICLWILTKLKWDGLNSHEALPDAVSAYRDEIRLLCEAERDLSHGSADILGDAWLKFRRVATKIKKNHPELRNRDIFRSILVVFEEMEANVSTE